VSGSTCNGELAQLYDSIRCEMEFDEINKELEGLYKKYELLYRQKMGKSSLSTQSASSSMGTNSLAVVVPKRISKLFGV
jgi:hypothetical protein